MHPSVLEFVARAILVSAPPIKGARVLEVGSYNVNGSVRQIIESLEPFLYLGVDQSAGPGVDLVVNCEKLTSDVHIGCGAWDLVVSTEMLEHTDDWRACMTEMTRAVTPGGLLLVTTRSPGYPYHPFPVDNWRFSLDDMKRIVEALGLDLVLLEDDEPSQGPGVFVLAHKPLDWLARDKALEHITVGGV